MKDFINKFDFNNPNWEHLPEDFDDVEPDDLSREELIKYNSIKTLWELAQPKKVESRSRVWKSPNGYIYLVSWSNASLLRILAVKWVQWIKDVKGKDRNVQDFSGPSSSSKVLQHPVHNFGWKYIERLEAQLLDCLRSAIAKSRRRVCTPDDLRVPKFSRLCASQSERGKGRFSAERTRWYIVIPKRLKPRKPRY